MTEATKQTPIMANKTICLEDNSLNLVISTFKKKPPTHDMDPLDQVKRQSVRGSSFLAYNLT